MILARRTRGEPLFALALVLVGWVGLRVFAWELALDADVPDTAVSPVTTAQQTRGAIAAASPRTPALVAHVATGDDYTSNRAGGFAVSPVEPVALVPYVARPAPGSPIEIAPLARPDALARQAPPIGSAPVPVGSSLVDEQALPANRIAVAGGHQMMWLAATALLPMPLGLRPAPERARAAAPSRWSGDGWLLIRRGNGTIAPGPAVGSYGASQAGAVLRYRLSPTDLHRLSAYVRGTGALNDTREQLVALGLAARPFPHVPVTAMAELRGQRDGAGQHLRPALALVTELPPQRLPLRFTGEVYVQGGYVGGRYPTAFIDGLARAERPVADVGMFRLRAGAGAWGAKQRGATRLDVGPTASIAFRVADTASARLAADWRFRVAGEAKPDSGPALTLSAGF